MPPESAAEQIAREQQDQLVRSARDKRAAGIDLTAAELKALGRREKEIEERYALGFLERVPQKLYRQWAGGRQTKQLQDHERAYGCPCTGPTISVPEVIGWLHDFLVARKQDLSTAHGEGSLKDQLAKRQIEQLELRIAKLQAEAAQRDAELAPVAELEQWLARKARRLRQAADLIQREFGERAADHIRLALDDAELEEPYAT